MMKSVKQQPTSTKKFVKVVVTDAAAPTAKAVETNGKKMNC
jgi:hypothetical protein